MKIAEITSVTDLIARGEAVYPAVAACMQVLRIRGMALLQRYRSPVTTFVPIRCALDT
jgi:hypothetical protein